MPENTPTLAEPASVEPQTVKGIAAAWLFKQRIETVLLIALMALMGYMVSHAIPYAITEIRSGLREQQTGYKESLKSVMDSTAEQQKIDRESQRLFNDAQRHFADAIQRIPAR